VGARGDGDVASSQQHADGVCLVNSFNGGKASSGFPCYGNFAARQHGQQPDAYIDIQTTGVVTWEGGKYQGKCFPVVQ